MKLLKIWRVMVKITFDPHDFWVGIFWRNDRKASWYEVQYYHRVFEIYMCLLPMIPIEICIRTSRIKKRVRHAT